MTTYSITLFVHVAGAMGYFVALALEWMGLRQILSTVSAPQAREWLGRLANVRKVAFASMLTAVITGIYMMQTAWRGLPWAVVTVGAVVLLILLTVVLAGPRMAALGRALGNAQPEPHAFHSLASHPLLRISLQTRVAIALGIVFLKSAKPDVAGSLVAVGAAVLLGLGSALAVHSHMTATERSAS